ncbi:MAG: hypothetical protein RIR65_2208 [Planctomycetota bacterium]
MAKHLESDGSEQEGFPPCSICGAENYALCGHLVGDCEDYSWQEPHPLYRVKAVEELIQHIDDLCCVHDVQAEARAWLERDAERERTKSAGMRSTRPRGRARRAGKGKPDRRTQACGDPPAWCRDACMSELVAVLREHHSRPLAEALLADHDTATLRALCAAWVADPAAALAAARDAWYRGALDVETSFLEEQSLAIREWFGLDCDEVCWSVDNPCMSQCGRAWLHEDPKRFLRETEAAVRAAMEILPRV